MLLALFACTGCSDVDKGEGVAAEDTSSVSSASIEGSVVPADSTITLMGVTYSEPQGWIAGNVDGFRYYFENNKADDTSLSVNEIAYGEGDTFESLSQYIIESYPDADSPVEVAKLRADGIETIEARYHSTSSSGVLYDAACYMVPAENGILVFVLMTADGTGFDVYEGVRDSVAVDYQVVTRDRDSSEVSRVNDIDTLGQKAEPLPAFEAMVADETAYIGKTFIIEGRVTNVTGWIRSESYRVGVYWDDTETYGKVAILNIPSDNYNETVVKGRLFRGEAVFGGLDEDGHPLFTCTAPYSVEKM